MDTPVQLRPLKAADAPRLAELANNVNVWLQLRNVFPHPYTLDDAISFIENARAGHLGKVYKITYQQTFAGLIGLVPQPDVYQRSYEIGYWLGEPYWGKGIATEAVRQLVEIGFAETTLVRIYAGIFSSNPASMRVLAKNGFVLEGIGRQAVYKNGQLLDEHRYALVRTEATAPHTL